MRVWVAGQWHDPKAEPIILVVTDQDKRNIGRMPSDAHRYMAYPVTQMTEAEAVALVRSVDPPAPSSELQVEPEPEPDPQPGAAT